MQNERYIRLWSRRSALALAIVLVAVIVLSNTLPFGANANYATGDKALSALGPKPRVLTDGVVSKQIGDLAYFNANTPFVYDKASVKLKIKNTVATQEVALGFQDKDVWHYDKSIVSEPIMDGLTLPRVGDGPYLYQKTPAYSDTRSFIAKPPTDKLIGTYDYDSAALEQATSIPDYQPAKTDTVITTPLRGQVTMYAYLKNEPFKMTITKRDLNWYGDPDVVTAKVYKGTDQVFEATIDDDGNDSNDRRLGVPQEVTMQNPGPGVPEAGVYKIVIDAPGDTVITKIQTNLHKLAFEGPLYVAANHEVYGDIVPATVPTSLVTNALGLTFSMDHNQPQTVSAGGKSVPLTSAGTPVTIDTGLPSATVTIPKSDVVVNGVGYFGFTQDQFFAPTPYHIVPITDAADLARVDYVLTDYVSPKKLADGWVEVERTFDLGTAVTQRGKLSWVISAPGLAAGNRTIEIKDISMTLTKKGWFRK